MSYDITDQHGLYFITFRTVGWIDVFTRQKYRDIVVSSFRYCQQHKGLRINAFVIMSNHLHLICYSEGQRLSAILRDFKKFTARKIIDSVLYGSESRKDWIQVVMAYHAKRHSRNHTYQLWEHYNHAIHLEDLDMIYQKLDYIHDNPVKAGIVDNPEEYIYSSARNYLGQRGVLDVELIDIVPLIGYVGPL